MKTNDAFLRAVRAYLKDRDDLRGKLQKRYGFMVEDDLAIAIERRFPTGRWSGQMKRESIERYVRHFLTHFPYVILETERYRTARTNR